MPDENGNPSPGEPGHWRYRKDMKITRGITRMASIVKESKPVEESLTESGAMGLSKAEQTALIKKLNPKAYVPKLEKERVKLILKLQKGK